MMKQHIKKIILLAIICITIIQSGNIVNAKNNWSKKIDYSYLKKVLYYLPEYKSVNDIGKKELGYILDNISWYKCYDFFDFPVLISNKSIIKKNIKDAKTYNQNMLVKKNTFDKFLNIIGYKGGIKKIIDSSSMNRFEKKDILMFISDRGSGSKGYTKIIKKVIKSKTVYVKYKKVDYWPDNSKHINKYTAKIVKGGKLGYKIAKIY